MAEALIILAVLAFIWPLFRRLRMAHRRVTAAPIEPGTADLAHPSREMLRRLHQVEEEVRLAHMRIDQIVCRPIWKK